MLNYQLSTAWLSSYPTKLERDSFGFAQTPHVGFAQVAHALQSEQALFAFAYSQFSAECASTLCSHLIADLFPVCGQRVTVIGVAPECQRTYNQSASRLRCRTLVPELILLVFLPLGDALYLRLVEAVHLILVATLLPDYTTIQPDVLPVAEYRSSYVQYRSPSPWQ